MRQYVNKQNYRIWVAINPHAMDHIPMHSERVAVWAIFPTGSIIDPYFFEIGVEQSFAFNGEPALDDMETSDM